MPVEIEIKLKIDDFAPLRDRLHSLGAVLIGNVLETNIFFDTPDGSLYPTDRGLRIRRSHPIAGGDDRIQITYKGPRQPGKIKQREEIELTIDDLDMAVALLNRLGYVRTLCFEKRRESWRFESSKVELDELPRLGLFVEIESPDASSVQRVRTLLVLDCAMLVPETYAQLVGGQIRKIAARDPALKFD